MHFCVVDEADSILIDEARTPLIISAVPGEAQLRAVACYEWAAEAAKQFEDDVDYEYDHEKKLSAIQRATSIPTATVSCLLGSGQLQGGGAATAESIVPSDEFQVVDGPHVGGVRHGDGEGPTHLPEGQDPVFHGHLFRNEA